MYGMDKVDLSSTVVCQKSSTLKPKFKKKKKVKGCFVLHLNTFLRVIGLANYYF